MKALTTAGLTKLIELIKANFIKNTDVEEAVLLDIDSSPTSASTHLVTSGGVYTAVNAKYTKPASGIPSSDMTSAVQTSLGKADSALQTHQSLSGYATETWVGSQGYLTSHQDISGKQDVISDLSTIRSGASAGATAVQPASISDMATQTWVGQQGYLTSHQDISGKENVGKITVGGTAYTVRTGSSGASGYITLVVE